MGTIRWTRQLATLALLAAVSLGSLLSGLGFVRDDDVLSGLMMIALGLVTGAAVVFCAWAIPAVREYETARLADEIRRTFARRR